MEYHLHKEYLSINEEIWEYITTRCSTVTKPIITQGKNRIKRLAVFNDLSRHTFGLDCEIYLLRFETKTQLQCMCRILGNNNLVGSRQHKPKLGKTVSVYDENILNIIVGNIVPEKFKRYTLTSGIDLIMAKSRFNQCELTIVARYKKAYFRDSSVVIESLQQTIHKFNLREFSGEIHVINNNNNIDDVNCDVVTTVDNNLLVIGIE